MISLSICVPTFNRSKYLNRLLESLAKQKDIENIETDLEIVIVDDDSNDQTSNIIEKWKMCNKFIINYFSKSTKEDHMLCIKLSLMQKVLLINYG